MVRLLSYSQVQKFIHCPYEWHLAYEEGWRAREKSEALVLGSVIHRHIADYLKSGGDVLDSVDLREFYDFQGESRRGFLRAQVTSMLVKFTDHFGRMLENGSFVLVAVEQHLRRGDFHGYVDCVADVDDHRIVIDWKTTKYPYDDWRAHVDDQLTAYAWLAELHHQIDEVAFVTLQKPHGKVEWHRSVRTQQQMDDFAQKVLWVRRQMHRGVRYRNTGTPATVGGARSSDTARSVRIWG
jgi:CRISPR/Cas system-associated exonuclease Cas4 (RecB family)